MTLALHGGAKVRLDNGHVLSALAPARPQGRSWRPVVGARVRVELSEDEMEGWRLARQP